MSLNGMSGVVTFEPLSASQHRGVIVVAVFALLSAAAVMFIALRTIQLMFFQRGDSTFRPLEILFFHTQLGQYGGCLLLSNMFISSAGLIDFIWASRSELSEGSICSAQAVFMQTGIWSTCWFTAALGAHTLGSLVFHVRQARWCSLVTVFIGWTIAFTAGLVPLQESKVYGPNGPSCDIAHSYPRDIFIFALAALPIILAASVTIAAYSVIFIVLHGKPRMNSLRELCCPNSSNQRGEDGFEEYHKVTGMIMWTMFWLPLASVLLLLPFCVTHILMYAENSVSFVLSVFADVCVSTLGSVNVGLLCYTFRVIISVYPGPHSAKSSVETFGNDASGESPIAPRPTFFSQSTISSYENGHQTHNPIQPPSNHTRGHSWSSVDSNTELFDAEKALYGVVQTKVTPLSSNGITSPTMLSRQLGGNPGIVPPQSNTKEQSVNLQSETMIDVPLGTARLGPRSPHVSFVTRDTWRGPPTQDHQCSFHPMVDTDAPTKPEEHPPTKGAKEPAFKTKDAAALNLVRFSGLSLPPSSEEVSNKSATLASGLGVPAPSACHSPQTSTVSAFPAMPIPRIEVHMSSPENTIESNSRPFRTSASAPTAARSDSDYLGEIVHVRKIRSLPPIPEPCRSEQGIADPSPPSPQWTGALSQRTTMTSVWSQETGYTLSQPLDAESQETRQQLVANVLVSGAMLGDQADAGDGQPETGTSIRPSRSSQNASRDQSRVENFRPISRTC